jgi:amino-acid N-acetyltransferase
VRWFREVAPYVHAFRGKTFVVAFGGELVQANVLNTLVQDLSLLSALGIKLVLVHGSRPQVNEQLRLKGFEQQFGRGRAPMDANALECAKEAAGEIRLDIEAAFSQGLPNTPMSHAQIRVLSGNFVTARPTGIIDGVDYQHTGQVRKIDVEALRFAIERGSIVLLSPLGFSPTGDAFNLSMEELATSVATALRAEKLIFLTETPGVISPDGMVDTELARLDADALLAEGSIDPDTAYYLQYASRAVKRGVTRAHLIPFSMDGVVLLCVAPAAAPVSGAGREHTPRPLGRQRFHFRLRRAIQGYALGAHKIGNMVAVLRYKRLFVIRAAHNAAAVCRPAFACKLRHLLSIKSGVVQGDVLAAF